MICVRLIIRDVEYGDIVEVVDRAYYEIHDARLGIVTACNEYMKGMCDEYYISEAQILH